MKKYIYLLESGLTDYDTFSRCVVCAYSINEARKTHPESNVIYENDKWYLKFMGKLTPYDFSDWVLPKDVKPTFIGIADEAQPLGVICSEYKKG